VLIRRASVDQLRTGQVVVLEQPRGDFVPASPPPHWPPSRREWLIKRVVAVPGEPLPETMQAAPGVAGSPVPPGKLLILGDNGAVSLDSRLLGYIDAERILGIMIRPMRTQHG
jgi:signal peptidase I